LKSCVQTIGAYVPSRVMSNEEVAQLVDTSDEWIYGHTGIRSRRIAAVDESASDMGVAATLKALELAEQAADPVDLSRIGMVLCATSTPDFLSFPSTANIIQHKLGLVNAGAMDLVAACTGFIYGIETAKAYVESGLAESVLVVGTEVYSRIVNWHDRATCVLFGDGAGAAVITRQEKGRVGWIGKGYLRSRGQGAEYLLRPAGGSRQPYIPGTTPSDDLYIHMNGRQVYVFAVQAIIDSVVETCRLNQVTMNEVDWIIPHQANRRILEAACDRNGWSIDKFHLNMDEYANTSAASIPLAMYDLITKGLLKRGQSVLTVGFGAGLTYGGNFFIY
jgi:3-oxoacyl-[acyl-carrier-protein] synthase-3